MAFIDAHRGAVVEGRRLGVELICRVLQVAPSTYYAAKARPPSARACRDAELVPKLLALWEDNYRVYGARKLWKTARRAGLDIGRDQVARLMRAAGIEGARRSTRVRTTRADPIAARHPDLVGRRFQAQAPNRLWVTDLTYVPTWAGVAYVCFIVDAFSRMIVGWRVAGHMRTTMVLDAMEMARWSRGTRLEGLRCHSDAGSQGGFHRSSQHLDHGGARMGRQPGWMTTITGRPAMRSPGRPPIRRDVERAFWKKIAQGLTSEDAAIACGVSGPVGSRWFRERGGMPLIQLAPLSGRYLSFTEREEIALLKAQDFGVREIARRLVRSPSTVSRELRRNAATRSGQLDYRAGTAQWKAELMARRPKKAKLVENDQLRDYVQDRLAGSIRLPDGAPAAGPGTPQWKGRNKPHRQDRRWATAWSPQQIANRLRVDFPDDASMRISHEAIYQALYVQSRGALRRELVTCLRTGRALRVPRSRARQHASGHVTAEVMISQRPAEVEDRAVPGHWEGDLIIGTDRSAIGTLVERATRFTMLLHLPRMAGFGVEPRVKNGPALGGYGAEAVREAITSKITSMPEQLRRSLTWDRGKELAQHTQLKIDTNVAVYFADPHSPWQRGTNENTNGLLRQYFPKGTDLSRWRPEEIEAVAVALNSRPRRTLGWKTPAEALDQLLSLQQTGVATTG